MCSSLVTCTTCKLHDFSVQISVLNGCSHTNNIVQSQARCFQMQKRYLQASMPLVAASAGPLPHLRGRLLRRTGAAGAGAAGLAAVRRRLAFCGKEEAGR